MARPGSDSHWAVPPGRLPDRKTKRKGFRGWGETMKSQHNAIALVTVTAILLRAQAPGLLPGEKEAPGKLAVPIRPIPAILDAFRSHAIVALGDDHGNEQLHAFRLALIRNPRFADTVNDIVVEFGN